MTQTLLLSVQPEHNRFRFFRVALEERDGHVELHRWWGRIGTDGRHVIEPFASPAEAQAAHGRLLVRRARRGYITAADEDLRRAQRAMAHRRAARRAPQQLQFPVGVGS
jgi:predicted DNA-binding WGR domain protein